MKNLKKVLALVTVVAMLLTCVPAVFASSYSDVSDSASYAEAVEMLSKLGIFTGYEDGTFQPDKSITRAEAAAVITRFLNQEDTAKAMNGTTIFTDMAGADWATGYVNYGVQKEYINGMGDGTFHPSDPVTYEQIVKMIVAALGYEIKAQDQGGYPSGYLSVASQLEITKGTSGSNGAATRGTVAKLLYQAIDKYKMIVTSYKSNGEKEYGSSKEDGSDTPLHQDHSVDKYEAVITGSYLTAANAKADDDKTVTFDLINNAKVNDEVNDKNTDLTDKYDETVWIGDTNAAEYVGYAVTAYVKADEDTDKPTIIAVSPKSNKNSVLTVPAANIAKPQVDNNGKTEDGTYANDGKKTVYYWKNKDSDKKATEIDLSTDDNGAVNATFIKNNKEGGDISTFDDDLTGVVTFISNDGSTNNGYEYVIISAYNYQFVIDEIDAENYIVTPKQYASPYTIDPEDKDVSYTIIKDGKEASFEDLEVGDTVSVIGEDDDANIVFYVSTAKAEGAVTRKSSSATNPKFTIDGSQYEATKDNKNLEVGTEGIFYLNVDGVIVDYDESSSSEGNYGYFIAADRKTSFGKPSWTVEFVDENGNDVTAKLDTKVKIAVGKASSGDSVSSDEVDTNEKSAANWAKLATVDANGDVTSYPQLIKYTTTSSGEIKTILIAGAKDPDAKTFNLAGKVEKDAEDKTGVTYKAKTNTAGKYEFDDDTVIFSVTTPKDGKALTADDVKISTVNALFTDGEDCPAFNAYDMEKNSKVIGAAVVYGASGRIDQAQNVVVVTSVSSTKFGDEVGYVIEGMQAGKAVSFSVCDAEETCTGYSDYLAKKVDGKEQVVLKKGDVIMVTEGLEYLTAIERKVSVDALETAQHEGPQKTGNRTYEDIFDLVTDRSGNNLTFKGLADDVNVSGATFTLVGTTNPNVTIKASSVSAINVDSSKYSYRVYVRMYDDDPVDVVIYEVTKVTDNNEQ